MRSLRRAKRESALLIALADIGGVWGRIGIRPGYLIGLPGHDVDIAAAIEFHRELSTIIRPESGFKPVVA